MTGIVADLRAAIDPRAPTLTQWTCIALVGLAALLVVAAALSALRGRVVEPLVFLFGAGYPLLLVLLLYMAHGLAARVWMVVTLALGLSLAARLAFLAFDASGFMYARITPWGPETLAPALLFAYLATILLWVGIEVALGGTDPVSFGATPAKLARNPIFRGRRALFTAAVAAVLVSFLFVLPPFRPGQPLATLMRIVPDVSQGLGVLLAMFGVAFWPVLARRERAILVTIALLAAAASFARGSRGFMFQSPMLVLATAPLLGFDPKVRTRGVVVAAVAVLLLFPPLFVAVGEVRDLVRAGIETPDFWGPIRGAVLDPRATMDAVTFLSVRLGGMDALVAAMHTVPSAAEPYFGVSNLVRVVVNGLVVDAWFDIVPTPTFGEAWGVYYDGSPSFVGHSGAPTGLGTLILLGGRAGGGILALAVGFALGYGARLVARGRVYGPVVTGCVVYTFGWMYILSGNLDILIPLFLTDLATVLAIVGLAVAVADRDARRAAAARQGARS